MWTDLSRTSHKYWIRLATPLVRNIQNVSQTNSFQLGPDSMVHYPAGLTDTLLKTDETCVTTEHYINSNCLSLDRGSISDVTNPNEAQCLVLPRVLWYAFGFHIPWKPKKLNWPAEFVDRGISSLFQKWYFSPV